MTIRTVRLDKNTEKVLQKLIAETGLSISGIIKKGIISLREKLAKETKNKPYDIFQSLELGEGSTDIPSANESRSAVVKRIKLKHKRRSKHDTN